MRSESSRLERIAQIEASLSNRSVELVDRLALSARELVDLQLQGDELERAIAACEVLIGDADLASDLTARVDARVRLGDILSSEARHDEARRTYSEALSLAGPYDWVRSLVSFFATACERLGDLEGARRYLNRALKSLEGSSDEVDVAETMIDIADLLLQTGDYLGARATAERSVDLLSKDDPRTALAFHQLGLVAQREGN